MALTPEDVVNKRFQPTKFREGYDQDEVDDFLDEVVVELRRLNQENEELRQRLIAARRPHQRAAARGARRSRRLRQAPAARPRAGAGAGGRRRPPSAAPAAPAERRPTTDQHQQPPAARPPPARGARREGIEKRDALIAEGHATAARVVAEAEASSAHQIGALEQERTPRDAASTSFAPSSATTARS